MPRLYRAHDLLWIEQGSELQGELPEWVSHHWHPALPLVVRRDRDAEGRIPVGVRGLSRDQRAAGWISPEAVRRALAPDALSDGERLLRSPFVSLPPLQAAIQLTQYRWLWSWGITGSVGYALATEVPVIHGASDLDLLLRCDRPASLSELKRWQQLIQQAPCRVDTQVETPLGAFALNEWLRDGRVMLKTDRGPVLTENPWLATSEQQC